MKVNKTELAEKINSLNCIDNETKSQLLELLHEHKRYGLVWENHKEDTEERLRNELPVLREIKERAIISDDPDSPNHILIEGDNLEALTTLSYTHEGKIDVIYIDPPYNTGHKDFIYNDSFVGEDDDYRHSKWLSFMKKRLTIAKRLLSKEGIIFISIDDNEYANLKLLCDSPELLGERNYLNTLIWHKNNTTVMLNKEGFSTCTEYILVYKNGSELLTLENEPISSKLAASYNKDDNDGRGLYRTTSLYTNTNGNKKISLKMPDGTFFEAQWQVTQETLDEYATSGLLVKTPSGWRKKIYLSNSKGSVPVTMLNSEIVGTTLNGTNEITQIFGQPIFAYPKPTSLVRYLIGKFPKKEATILDFFAGSGTTLHATMQLNADDGGHRQCIIVTNNENNICEEVTYKRNKRVINGYTTPKGEKIEGLHNNTLHYYKTDFVARESSLTAKKELMTSCTDLLCIKEDIYTERPKFGSLTLRPTVARYFSDGDRQMLIIYNPEAIERIVEEIATLEVKEPIAIYIFSLNDYAYDADFADVDTKVRLCALPAAIYRAYLKVLPKKQTTLSEETPINEINFEED